MLDFRAKLRELIDRLLPPFKPKDEGDDDEPLSIQRIKIYPIRCSNCGAPLEDGDLVVIWKSGAITHYDGENLVKPKEPSHAN